MPYGSARYGNTKKKKPVNNKKKGKGKKKG
jgi:hypothetical protein